MSGHARPKLRFQIVKWDKGWEHSTVEMRSESDLRLQSISQAIHAWVKAAIPNREGGVAVAKINDCDKNGKKYMATIYFIVRTGKMNTKIFPL